MSASDTAIRVIDWTLSGRGPCPRGDIRLCDELAEPSAELRGRVAALCSIACAQLGWLSPPLGNNTPLSMDAALIASAVGFAEPSEVANFLLRGVRSSDAPAEWATRHALVSKVDMFVPKIAPFLRQLSPLTPLFDHATLAESPSALRVSELLRAHPDGRRSLIQTLACPTPSYLARQWRTKLLEQWRLGSDDDRRLALEIYEATLVFHEKAAISQINQAVALLRSNGSSDRPNLPPSAGNENQAAPRSRELTAAALSVGNWWRPLAMIQRNHPDLLRSIRHLRISYRRGLELSRLTSRLQGDPS